MLSNSSEKEDVLKLINSISEASESMVAATEEVNASAEEQQAIIGNICGRTQKLNEMAEGLENAVDRFKV